MKNIYSRKHILTALLIALTCLALAGCSGGGKSKVSVDPAALAKTLAEKTVTSETLTQTAAEMVAATYYISEDVYANGCSYKGTGATACEVAVIECKKADQTKDVEKLFKDHVASQSDLYASYNAGEVEKLDKAVIQSAGNYVVLCVCDDADAASSILKENGF